MVVVDSDMGVLTVAIQEVRAGRAWQGAVMSCLERPSMENRLESLLLMARAEVSQLCGDRDGAYRLLREALSCCPATALERLFQFHLGNAPI